MAKKVPLDVIIIAVLIMSLIFVDLNFNSTLAAIYKTFALAITFIYFFVSKGKAPVTINSIKNNTLQAMGKGLAGMGAVIVASVLISGLLKSAGLLQSSLTPLGYFSTLQSSTPVLSESTILTFISWGTLIPLLETLLFGYLFVLYLKTINVRVNDYRNPKWLGAVTVLSTGFAFLHLEAKGVEPVGMISTFLFMVMTLILISLDKEMESSLWAHIFNNSIVVAGALGWLALGGV